MIDIQIADAKPEVTVSPEFRADLAVFRFDTERYIDGLTLAEVPSETIDTLAVHFKKVGWHSLSLTGVLYDHDEHTVNVKMFTNKDQIVEPFKNGQWTTATATPSLTVNYGLAKSAKYIADETLSRPDAVAIRRIYGGGGEGRVAALGLAATTGSIAGAQVAEAAGASILVGSLVGMGVGALSDIAGLFILDKRRGVDRSDQKRQQHVSTMERRAKEFANTPEAFDIFKDVVEIQFLTKSLEK